MSWGETLMYITVGNPISSAVLSSASSVLDAIGIKPKKIERSAVMLPPKPITMWDLTNKNYHFVRLAGLSGATAVIMGAYGKRSIAMIPDVEDQKNAKSVFDTANRFHFLHSFALLAMPLVKRPALTGSLMVTGCLLFCVPMYYRAVTGDKTFTQVATCGGFCLIAAWASLLF